MKAWGCVEAAALGVQTVTCLLHGFVPTQTAAFFHAVSGLLAEEYWAEWAACGRKVLSSRPGRPAGSHASWAPQGGGVRRDPQKQGSAYTLSLMRTDSWLPPKGGA